MATATAPPALGPGMIPPEIETAAVATGTALAQFEQAVAGTSTALAQLNPPPPTTLATPTSIPLVLLGVVGVVAIALAIVGMYFIFRSGS
ncbi:MAG TPA: hypothetical protein VFI11_09595 [Anaerolineales bacterium]|nr:hypothetical protein [Anaerolineales bacterium]